MGKILGLLGMAIAPPAAAFAFLQTWAKAHPVLALVVLVAYEAVVLGLGFAGKLVGGTADELNKRWKDDLARTIDEGTRRRFSGFERRYRESVLGSLRFIDLKGLATMGFYTPELDEVFVDVSLAHSDPTTVPSDVLGHRQTQRERRVIGDLINQQQPVVLAVIGAPGCGKTTLLRHTALLVCRERRRRRRKIPALLYLRDHVQAITEGTALPDVIDRAAPVGWFEQQLRAGSCVVLLDGLDEVADQQNRRAVSDWVERQIIRYPLNDFVITSRPHGYETAPVSGADIVQVRGFTDDQVTRFVRSWYFAFEQRSTGEKSPEIARRAEEEANDLLERLHQNPSLYELTVNPLLLTMIANVHKFRGALPGSRVDLYSEICQVLLWRRQEAKKLVSELTGDQKMTLLSGLAYSMMSRQLRDISRDDLSAEFRSSLRRMARGMDEQDFMADMTSCGLLLERERDMFAFAHLTFQEYLAAHHIREKQLAPQLAARVDDAWWRETTLLFVARANADPIVRACLESGTVAALSLALDCSEEGSELSPGLRGDLDAMLRAVSDSGDDTSFRNLMVQVVVSRYLRRLVRTGEGTRLCAEPVSNRIYQLFLDVHPHCSPDVPLGAPDEPVRGVWGDDALSFVEWVNRLSPGVTFRLPRQEELRSSPTFAKLRPLSPWIIDSNSGLPYQEIHYQTTREELRSDLQADLGTMVQLELEEPPNGFVKLRHHIVETINAASARGSSFRKHFPRSFLDAACPKGEVAYLTSLNGYITAMQGVPLSRQGQAMLPVFDDLLAAIHSEPSRLDNSIASWLRIAAMCLVLETSEDRQEAFRGLAANVSVLQRRADGRLPANETIILATD
ncbi:hypothetical protein GCM10011609_18970 [Lentzea pudingi]|uniref:NACHT domain-containing protein n=1 Tax=Lentzea pudingi TaxID=1789439 RepID=A0ABQ2HLP9_9PSEU|nr:NACHT domain-containing protein [Lentzea pudingi]GGM83263.1 hypothetical protein GCM10011609_18970 [Lentzea pudingi]